MTPRVTISQLDDAAGKFVEEDGWVKIVLGAAFATKPVAVQAILCHEICHYILEANGIRQNDLQDNERLTDVAMFVFGLGRVFLESYRDHPHLQYGKRHRLGYLTDEEYRYLERQVPAVRAAAGLVSETKEVVLLRRLRTRLGDKDKVQRYLDAARRKHPQMSDEQRLEEILRDLYGR